MRAVPRDREVECRFRSRCRLVDPDLARLLDGVLLVDGVALDQFLFSRLDQPSLVLR